MISDNQHIGFDPSLILTPLPHPLPPSDMKGVEIAWKKRKQDNFYSEKINYFSRDDYATFFSISCF